MIYSFSMKWIPLKLTIFLFALCPFFWATESFAEEIQSSEGVSKVVIVSPKPGDMLPAAEEVQIVYQFIKGKKDGGNHVHVYLDGKNQGTTRRSPRGIGKLSPGKHTVLLKVSNSDHEWVNVEATVQFEVSPPR